MLYVQLGLRRKCLIMGVLDYGGVSARCPVKQADMNIVQAVQGHESGLSTGEIG